MYLFVFLLLSGLRTLNAQGSAFTINKVELKALPSNILKNGAKLELDCSVEIVKTGSFLLKYSISFYKNDDLIYNVSSFKEHETYTINSTRVSSSGSYKCKVDVNGREKTSMELPITVTGLSKPILRLSKKEVKEGEEIIATCEAAEEDPPFTFTFYKTPQNKERQEKSKMSNTKNYAEALFQIAEGERILKFECVAKILSVPNQETSDTSEKQMVAVVEPFSTPRFEVWPSVNFTEGQNMTVRCSAQTSHAISEPVEITIQKDKQILKSSQTGSAVYFQLATESHMGNYTCKAESRKTAKTSSISITVTELFSRPRLLSNVKELDEGNVLAMSCSVPGLSRNASGSQSYYLRKGKGHGKLMNTGGKYDKKAAEYDTGVYVCEVTISNITKRSDPLFIKVYAPVSMPVLTHLTQHTGMVVLGQTLELSCMSQKGTLPITYTLVRKTEQLGRINVYVNESAVFKVNVTEPRVLDGYQCLATNKNTFSNQTSVMVNITVITPVRNMTLIVIPSNGEVEDGRELSLVCKVENGSFPIEFQFFKHGRDRSLHSVTVNGFSAAWQCLSFGKHEEGSYFCKASNRANRTIESTPVTVKAVLATWKKGVIGGFVMSILLVGAAVLLYFYLDKKKKGKEISLDMTRPTNSNNDKPSVAMKAEEDSYFVSGTVHNEDENHVVKTPEQGLDQQNHEVEYTEVELAMPDPHRGAGERHSARIEGSPDAT
ncbi:platelet endothelial cell adhesion molecule isoform X2 [Ascaphus truei]|uniref:platelet endothelial cell adhesion molecule isoform X2 n=1 Tax=Ascaphus truei TaxID=8439 RepID=UPI003F594262